MILIWNTFPQVSTIWLCPVNKSLAAFWVRFQVKPSHKSVFSYLQQHNVKSSRKWSRNMDVRVMNWDWSTTGRRDFKLPFWPSFDWERLGIVQLRTWWSVCRRGCLKGKSAHANRPRALLLGTNTWAPLPCLRSSIAGQSERQFVYYVMFSRLSRGRSATSP